jgi:hypothetical protein
LRPSAIRRSWRQATGWRRDSIHPDRRRDQSRQLGQPARDGVPRAAGAEFQEVTPLLAEIVRPCAARRCTGRQGGTGQPGPARRACSR